MINFYIFVKHKLINKFYFIIKTKIVHLIIMNVNKAHQKKEVWFIILIKY